MNYTEEEVSRAMDGSPALWTIKHQIKNESGVRLEFEKRRFLFQIYNDFSPKIVLLKPPQIGATVMACIKALWAAKKYHKDVIYTLPTQSDVQDIVGGSFNRIIAQNTELSKWVKDHDTVEQKAVGSNLIRYRGTFSPKQAMMVPSSLNIHDEVDTSDPDVLTLYQTRQEAQEREEDKWTWYLSHPSIAGHGIDVYWQLSDKKEWFITCPHCGAEQYMRWPENVDVARGEYVCSSCYGVLPDKTRIEGYWKPTANGSYSGYHVSQLMLFNKSAKDIIAAYNDPLKDRQYFYNYVLGLPYIQSEDRIDPSIVLKNCVDVVNPQEGMTVIGADTGHGIHYVLMNEKGVFYYDHASEITASKDPYDTIKGHLRRFPRSIAIFDQGGDLIGVRKLQAEFPGRVFLAFYRRDRKTTDFVQWGKGDKYGAVYVDRNKMMTLVIEQIREIGRVRLNGTPEEWADFASHFGNIYREQMTSRNMPDKHQRELYGHEYVWKRNGPDHYVHALLYAIVGLDKGVGEMAQIVGGGALDDLPKAQMIEVNPKGEQETRIILGSQWEE